MAMLAIVGTNIVLARNLVPADDGTFPFSLSATQNGVTVSATGSLTVTAAAVPTAVVLGTPAPSMADNSAMGAVVSGFTITTSDGSAFVGDVTVTGPA